MTTLRTAAKDYAAAVSKLLDTDAWVDATCPTCEGKGWVPATVDDMIGPDWCPECGGSGGWRESPIERVEVTGSPVFAECDPCNGEGVWLLDCEVGDIVCDYCEGTGLSDSHRMIRDAAEAAGAAFVEVEPWRFTCGACQRDVREVMR